MASIVYWLSTMPAAGHNGGADLLGAGLVAAMIFIGHQMSR
jgi:hypothetical protein